MRTLSTLQSFPTLLKQNVGNPVYKSYEAESMRTKHLCLLYLCSELKGLIENSSYIGYIPYDIPGREDACDRTSDPSVGAVQYNFKMCK